MSDDKQIIEAMKDALKTVHRLRQSEAIKFRIFELETKGLKPDQVVAALRKNPPVITPNF